MNTWKLSLECLTENYFLSNFISNFLNCLLNTCTSSFKVYFFNCCMSIKSTRIFLPWVLIFLLLETILQKSQSPGIMSRDSQCPRLMPQKDTKNRMSFYCSLCISHFPEPLPMIRWPIGYPNKGNMPNKMRGAAWRLVQPGSLPSNAYFNAIIWNTWWQVFHEIQNQTQLY